MDKFSDCIDVYFTHPFSSYERGSNERHNGLLRKFLPKGKSMNVYEPEDVLHFGDVINAIPRKILGYKTPENLFEVEIDKIYSV